MHLSHCQDVSFISEMCIRISLFWKEENAKKNVTLEHIEHRFHCAKQIPRRTAKADIKPRYIFGAILLVKAFGITKHVDARIRYAK